MNLIVLEPKDLLPDGTARISGRRLLHACTVLHVKTGDQIRVGTIEGNLGIAEVLSINPAELNLRLRLAKPPPPRPGIDLVLAMPRPKTLRRLLSVIAQLGVDKVVLLNSARVERSYFSSPALQPEAIRRGLFDGLEQAGDTILPEVLIRNRFRPFVEDELDLLFCTPSQRLLAHPGAKTLLQGMSHSPRRLVSIGPDGGWVPFEIELFVSRGFTPVSLGERVLRTEALVPYLIGALRG